MRILLTNCVVVAVIALLLSACGSPSNLSGAPSTETVMSTQPLETPTTESSGKTSQTPSPQSTPDVPVYPNASQVSTIEHSTPPWTRVSFETDDNYEKVFEYYKDTLTKQGWLLTQGSINQGLLIFVWKPTVEGPVVNDDLSVSIGQSESGKTEVTFQRRPWPDPNRLPLYPGAQQVKEEYSLYPGRSADWQHVITYSTAATPDAIQAFYESTLPTLAWEFVASNGSDISSGNGIRFGYIRGDSFADNKNGSVYIVANVETAGETQVKLTTLGDDVQPPATPQK